MKRIICLVIVCCLVSACAIIPPLVQSVSDFCPANADVRNRFWGSPDADDLIIFIHGFCGDANTTWINPDTQFDFPRELAQDLAEGNTPAYIVSFSYFSDLQGGPSILSIAKHLELKRLIKVPARFYQTDGGFVA